MFYKRNGTVWRTCVGHVLKHTLQHILNTCWPCFENAKIQCFENVRANMFSKRGAQNVFKTWRPCFGNVFSMLCKRSDVCFQNTRACFRNVAGHVLETLDHALQNAVCFAKRSFSLFCVLCFVFCVLHVLLAALLICMLFWCSVLCFVFLKRVSKTQAKLQQCHLCF